MYTHHDAMCDFYGNEKEIPEKDCSLCGEAFSEEEMSDDEVCRNCENLMDEFGDDGKFTELLARSFEKNKNKFDQRYKDIVSYIFAMKIKEAVTDVAEFWKKHLAKKLEEQLQSLGKE